MRNKVAWVATALIIVLLIAFFTPRVSASAQIRPLTDRAAQAAITSLETIYKDDTYGTKRDRPDIDGDKIMWTHYHAHMAACFIYMWKKTHNNSYIEMMLFYFIKWANYVDEYDVYTDGAPGSVYDVETEWMYSYINAKVLLVACKAGMIDPLNETIKNMIDFFMNATLERWNSNNDYKSDQVSNTAASWLSVIALYYDVYGEYPTGYNDTLVNELKSIVDDNFLGDHWQYSVANPSEGWGYSAVTLLYLAVICQTNAPFKTWAEDYVFNESVKTWHYNNKPADFSQAEGLKGFIICNGFEMLYNEDWNLTEPSEWTYDYLVDHMGYYTDPPDRAKPEGICLVTLLADFSTPTSSTTPVTTTSTSTPTSTTTSQATTSLDLPSIFLDNASLVLIIAALSIIILLLFAKK